MVPPEWRLGARVWAAGQSPPEDAGSRRVLVIGGYLSVFLAFWLAVLFPDATMLHGRRATFGIGVALLLAGGSCADTASGCSGSASPVP